MPEGGSLTGSGVVERAVFGMQMDGDFGKGRPDRGYALDMIEVRVGEKDRRRGRAGGLEVAHHTGRDRARIHHHRLAVRLADRQVPVLP